MPVTKEEEDRSKNPLYNRELLKQIMTGAPSLMGGVGAETPAAAEKAVPAQAAPATPKPSDPAMSWSEVPAEAVKNIGPSLVGVGESIVAPIMHPLETAASIGALGKGAYSKAAGALGAEQNPEEKAKEEAPLNAVIDFYKQRYGTEEGFKQALAKDPAGVAADLSSFLTGGGSMAARLPGKLGKAGEIAQAVGRAGPIGEAVQEVAGAVTKPIAKAVTAPTSALFAFTAGKPFKTMQDAAQAGFELNPEFLRHLGGEGSADEIVNRIEGAVSTIADQRSKDYVAGMKDPTASQVPLGYGNIDAAIQSSVPKFTHLGKVYNQEAKNAFDRAVAKVDEWRSQPPQAGAHTIEDMDKLKRSLDEIHVEYSKDFGADSPAAKIVSDIRRSVFNTIKNQDPRYAEVMEKYADATRQLKEIRKDLIGGRTTTVGAKMRKLLSKGGDRAHKEQLLAELEKIDPDIGFALAGHELSSFIPQGLLGRVMGAITPAAVGAATFNPLSVLAAGAASPMLTGATQYGIGAAMGLPTKMPLSIPYAAGEALEREKERPQRAAGGKVARGMTADMIIAAVKRAHNHGKNETEDMLNLPDESVAKALEVAKRGI
jgi:hypothetical protein